VNPVSPALSFAADFEAFELATFFFKFDMRQAGSEAKVVFLGKEYSGKTSLVHRYFRGKFVGDSPGHR